MEKVFDFIDHWICMQSGVYDENPGIAWLRTWSEADATELKVDLESVARGPATSDGIDAECASAAMEADLGTSRVLEDINVSVKVQDDRPPREDGSAPKDLAWRVTFSVSWKRPNPGEVKTRPRPFSSSSQSPLPRIARAKLEVDGVLHQVCGACALATRRPVLIPMTSSRHHEYCWTEETSPNLRHVGTTGYISVREWRLPRDFGQGPDDDRLDVTVQLTRAPLGREIKFKLTLFVDHLHNLREPRWEGKTDEEPLVFWVKLKLPGRKIRRRH